jgi:glycosyltransferase involved in cell wall biosynthesis
VEIEINFGDCYSMKLSVIVPAFNRSELLPDTIESILRSGLEDFEILVVDDGSTDETPDVVRAFGPPVRYLRQANGGPASARNKGFAASAGQYVAFLDSDDRWLPGAVPILVRHLDAHAEIPFIFGDARMGSPDTGFVSVVETYGGDAFRNLPSREIDTGVRYFDRKPFFRQLLRRNLVFLGSLLLRREIIAEVRGFDSTLFGSEDWEFALHLALRYDFAYCESLAVAAYHQHLSNLTRDQDRMYAVFCKALERLLEKPGLEAEERTAVVSRLRRCKFGYAYPAYDRGDLQAARARFFDCLRSGFAWEPFFYWLACQLPPPLITQVRRLKQRYSGGPDAASALRNDFEPTRA